MKVKVIKCSSRTYWYQKEIGKIFNVFDEVISILGFRSYQVLSDGSERGLAWCDCMEVAK